MSSRDRYSVYRALYGEEGYSRIANAKILVVGAGGIGCEILKNLALVGCKEIDLIDLDTIDVSNLNRQFLFRPEHVGQPKAVIAAKAAETFNPDIKVNAYHDNIKNTRFSTSYFSKFDVVLNALDNLDARRHVNRLCLAAKVPLYDAGTTGYLGQVMPIVKGLTACYECFPKPSPKVYPICTIRSTPDKPVHCIVWAKECFKLLFARPVDSMLFEDESATNDKSEYMHLITYPSEKTDETLFSFAEALTIGLFHRETQKKIDMDVYKTAAKTPVATSVSLIAEAVQSARAILASAPTTWKYDRYEAPARNWEQTVPSLLEALVDFVLCVVEVGMNEESAALIGQLSFDKDDFWAMRFVSACANIRSAIFSIPILSFHDGKGIAGNIIPAIATTNAIVSGAQVALALKSLAYFTKETLYNLPTQLQEHEHDEDKRKELLALVRKVFPHTYCVRHPNRKGYFLQPSAPDTPVSSCYVCGTSQLTLLVDTTHFTLQHLVTKVLKGKLGFNEPAISQGSNILYEEGDGADEDLAENLPLSLATCPGGGIHDGAMLEISDFTQHLELTLLIVHRDNSVFQAMIDAEEQKIKEQGSSGSHVTSVATALSVDMFLLEGEQSKTARTLAETEEVTKNLANSSGNSNSNSNNNNTDNTAKNKVVAEDDDDDVVMVIDEVQYESEKQQKEDANNATHTAVHAHATTTGGGANNNNSRKRARDDDNQDKDHNQSTNNRDDTVVIIDSDEEDTAAAATAKRSKLN